MEAESFLKAKAQQIESALAAEVDSWGGAPDTLIAAVRYSLLNCGKRLRPALTLGAAEIIAGDGAAAMPAACAIEMIHTYSLIHDDLPAMDDDDLRRGKPTLHKAFNEATAILAGDALCTHAFELAARTGNLGVVREIALAAGVNGMVGGQQRDLEAEGRQLTLEQLRVLHAGKTGALMRAAVRCGAIVAGADVAQLVALTAYGENLGLAFQIADDILNVTGTEAELGKAVGSDESRNKSTYPALVGLEQARALAEEAADAAVAALKDFGEEADAFRHLTRFTIDRSN